MREIKFRAWDKKTKKMRVVDSMAFFAKKGFPSFFELEEEGTPKVVNVWGTEIIGEYAPKDILLHREPKLDGIALMQYTGLKDNNGKEIYEGDVVRTEGDEEIPQQTGKVFWNEEWCSFRWSDGDEWSLNTELEVIGNIYENPELI